MKISNLLLAFIVIFTLHTTVVHSVARFYGKKAKPVEGQYVIVLNKRCNDPNRFKWDIFKEKLKNKYGISIKHKIEFGSFKALVVETRTFEEINSTRHDEDIDFVEMNEHWTLFKSALYTDFKLTEASDTSYANLSFCYEQDTGRDIWGLSRLNQRDTLPRRGDFSYTWDANENGTGVDAYIMDSGIYVEHSEFEGRAIRGFTSSSISAQEGDEDFNGHGTHVAAKVGGKVFGVAKNTNLIAVKVLNGEGAGTTVDLLEGIQFIYNDQLQKKEQSGKPPKVVVNLSLGAEGSAPAMEQAIEVAIQNGITFVVAAGNEYRDACGFTPSRVANAITVGSSTIQDTLSTFSNYGPCVDILAPGSDILSAWIGEPSAMARASGTSMASPHVAGVAARYLSYPWEEDAIPTPDDVRNHLIDTASSEYIELNVGQSGDIAAQSTPNKLLYARCASGFGAYSQASVINVHTLVLLTMTLTVFSSF